MAQINQTFVNLKESGTLIQAAEFRRQLKAPTIADAEQKREQDEVYANLPSPTPELEDYNMTDAIEAMNSMMEWEESQEENSDDDTISDPCYSEGEEYTPEVN